MGKTTLRTLIICVSTVCSALGCVVTGPDQKEVPVGSNVRLSCILTQCLKSLGHHQLHVEWEFTDKGLMDKDRHHLIYHYQDQTVIVEPRVFLVGNISEGDFSLLLLSVTVQSSGTYLCHLRPPPGNPDIHESHTQLTVVERSGQHRRFPGDFHKLDVTHPNWLLPLCCMLLLLFLVGGVTAGMWACRRRSQQQQNDQGHIQVNIIRGEDTQEANGNKDPNCYVTLQRFRAPPRPLPHPLEERASMLPCTALPLGLQVSIPSPRLTPAERLSQKSGCSRKYPQSPNTSLEHLQATLPKDSDTRNCCVEANSLAISNGENKQISHCSIVTLQKNHCV